MLRQPSLDFGSSESRLQMLRFRELSLSSSECSKTALPRGALPSDSLLPMKQSVTKGDASVLSEDIIELECRAGERPFRGPFILNWDCDRPLGSSKPCCAALVLPSSFDWVRVTREGRGERLPERLGSFTGQVILSLGLRPSSSGGLPEGTPDESLLLGVWRGRNADLLERPGRCSEGSMRFGRPLPGG
mmetsp:Transcript_19526/g.46156  ORF Transcript_19526/g.46156 Transcript_19526/m.46156 type:complete len:189 (+) Transcript_19526:1241-1807(+)